VCVGVTPNLNYLEKKKKKCLVFLLFCLFSFGEDCDFDEVYRFVGNVLFSVCFFANFFLPCVPCSIFCFAFAKANTCLFSVCLSFTPNKRKGRKKNNI